MAAPLKRQHDEDSESPKTKKILLDDSSDLKLQSFLEWCEKNDFKLTKKVRVGREGSCAQYGMIAVEDIAEGYPLFQIPRKCLLTPENCGIADVLSKECENLSATNQWVPLLISLLHEQANETSKWRPYLDLVPDYKSLDLPMFWESSEVVKYLQGTGVDLKVQKDCEMIKTDFDTLVQPFFDKYPKFKTDKIQFEYFKKMVAFVMAYSFTEPEHREDSADNSDSEDDDEPGLQPPMMVPMADMLNHVTDNNAKLTFGDTALKMVTTRPIEKGEEIFNTYGQVSNLHLMHMYHFAEKFPDNYNDVVEIPASYMLQACLELNQKEDSFIKEKWQYLKDQEVVSDDELFVIGHEGIITDEICRTSLKVMSMSQSEFSEQKEREGWSDAENEDSLSGESRLAFEKIPSIEKSWKLVLERVAHIFLSKYPSSLEEDTEKLKTADSLKDRARYSLYTAHGQKWLLHELINSCKNECKNGCC